MPDPMKPPMPRAPRRLLTPVLCSLGLGLAGLAQAQVASLSPQELPAFLAAHEVAVVQYTSPDPKCGFCVGADKPFDAMAALAFDPRRGYARVQWQPWRQFPAFPAGVQATDKIPMVHVYVRGQLAGQYEGRPGHMLDIPVRVFESVSRLQSAQAPQKPGAAALNAAQLRSAQVFLRLSLMQSLMLDCAQKAPTLLPRLQGAMKEALRPLQAELEPASRLGDTLAERWPGMAEAAQAQIQQRQHWLTQTLGLPGGAVDERSCAKAAQGLGSWPLP